MTTYKFRPEYGLKQMVLTNPEAYRSKNMNWQKRNSSWYEQNKRPLNEITLGRIFARFHTLVAHGPQKAAKRHEQGYKRFRARDPQRRVSTKYWNTISASRFL